MTGDKKADSSRINKGHLGEVGDYLELFFLYESGKQIPQLPGVIHIDLTLEVQDDNITRFSLFYFHIFCKLLSTVLESI